jgi:ubiquinone/menaquinone biosynthesis C-methylase UbiE
MSLIKRVHLLAKKVFSLKSPGNRLKTAADSGGIAIPPPKLRAYVGGPDFFAEIGDEFVRYFTDLCDLQPGESVLDIGCGIGRMAIPLTRYMNNQGQYRGFDIVKSGIDWCNENITPKYPNFQFYHSNIFNDQYNPGGQIMASKYEFPFPDESFDFVFLTSVFTHMLPDDINHYSSEIARVLKSNGRSLITYFLLNNESVGLIRDKKSTLDFQYDFEFYKVVNKKCPEAAIAYVEPFIYECYRKNNFIVKQPIHYGSWCGRSKFLSYQDIVIASKC